MATEYYEKLLTPEPEGMQTEACRLQIWSRIFPKVTKDMKAKLRADLSTEELVSAIKDLPHNSFPGEDGLPPIFFLEYWDLVKDPLCAAFQEIIDTGVMPAYLSSGMIFLIPKGEGPSEDIRKWRPITILSTAYNILAKTINLRLQPMLNQLIHDSQTGFVKDCSILDNIFSNGPKRKTGHGGTTSRFREGL